MVNDLRSGASAAPRATPGAAASPPAPLAAEAPIRGQRLPRSARRAQLLEAAQGAFVESGYYAAAMDDIAERAGVSKPVLYQHFPGKLELYVALLDAQCSTLEQLVKDALDQPHASNRDKVEATVTAYFDFVTREDAAFRLIFESDLTSVPQVRSRIEDLSMACSEAIAEVITADSGLDAERALLIGTALAGLAQVTARHWLAQADAVSKDEAAGIISRLAWRGMGGLPRAEA